MPKTNLSLVIPLVLVAFVLAGCAAGGGAAPTVSRSPSPAADDKPCASSTIGPDAVELDVTEMPVLGGATLPVPDCLLMSDSDDLYRTYQAYYLDTSGAIHDAYNSALLGAGFKAEYVVGDPDSWVRDFPDPTGTYHAVGLGVQGQGAPERIRDGDAISYTIGIPRFCLEGGC